MAQRRASAVIGLVSSLLAVLGVLAVVHRVDGPERPVDSAALSPPVTDPAPARPDSEVVGSTFPSTGAAADTGAVETPSSQRPGGQSAATHSAGPVEADRSAPAPGTYRIRVAVRSDEWRRAEITVDGAKVASHRATPEWREVEALAFVHGPDTALDVWPPEVEHGTITLEPVPPAFTTRGIEIIDPAGRVFVPRGANRAGYQRWVDGGHSHNQHGHEGAPMAAWGMNTVRLPLNQEFWLSDCPVEHSTVHDVPRRSDGGLWTYRQVIDEEVRRFNAAGLLVVLDLHITSRGQATGCELDSHDQKELPDVRSVEFWRSVASRYRDQRLVAFDLFNEPQLRHAVDPPDSQSGRDRLWRDGGTVAYRVGLTRRSYQAVGMQRLLDVVRHEARADNLVFVSGLKYALDVGVHVRRPLEGTSIVAAPHLYCSDCRADGPNEGHQRLITGEADGEAPRVGALDVMPVVALEFGSDEPHDPGMNAAFIEWLETVGVGWTVHVWGPGGHGRGLNVWGILDPHPPEPGQRLPSPSGEPVWNILAPYRTETS